MAVVFRRPSLFRPLPGQVCEILKARKPHYILDSICKGPSSPSHLLDVSLSNFLPASLNRPLSSSLPAGYHLIHFPNQVPSQMLLADGTDTLHYPGEPWVRRAWAGGSIEFRSDSRRKPLLYTRSNRWLCCQEQIRDAVVKGRPGDEKLWVDLERIIGSSKHKGEDTSIFVKKAAIIERRNLVFMPAKLTGQNSEDAAKVSRIIKPTIKADVRVPVVPDANMLFRFSALTFNAHRIHLDREYAQIIEGYRDLVVHGPLSVILMLKVLTSQIGAGDMVKNITYKNLVPLYAYKTMTICVRRVPSEPGTTSMDTNEVETQGKVDNETQKWDVWIEGPEGGYAVKGSAETGRPDPEIQPKSQKPKEETSGKGIDRSGRASQRYQCVEL